MTATLQDVHDLARRADARAEAAANHALAAHEQTGNMARELGEVRKLLSRGFDTLGGRVDAAISDVRSLAREVRKLQTVENAVRDKLASFTDLDALAGLTEREVARIRRGKALRKLARRMVTAAAVGGATLTGAAIVWMLLRHFGVHIPAELLP